MSFLATQLREEGTYEVKRDLVEALAGVMTEIPQVRPLMYYQYCHEKRLFLERQLAEFIFQIFVVAIGDVLCE